MMRILTGFGLLVLLLTVAGAGWTQEPGEPPPPSGDAALGAPPPTLHGELALSVEDAIAMSIENNLEVEIARFTPPIADLVHTEAWGLHDPVAFGSLGYSSIDTPAASTLEPSALIIERETSGGAGVMGLIPRLGAQYEISYGGRRLTTSQAIPDLSPEYRANLLGSLTLPLLQGAWWGEPWVLVKQTGIGSEIADEDFRFSLMNLVTSARTAYWSVAAARERRRVAQKSLEARRGLLDQTEAQYEVGVVSQVEVTEAKAGVADAEFTLIVAENAYRANQDNLIQIVLGPNLTPDSRLEIRPTDSPEEIVTYAVDPEEANRKALVHRPEIAIARKNVERQEIELKFRKNRRLPGASSTSSSLMATRVSAAVPTRRTRSSAPGVQPRLARDSPSSA